MEEMKVVMTNTKTLETKTFDRVKSVRPNSNGGIRIISNRLNEETKVTLRESEYFDMDWIATVFPFILEV